MTHSEPTNDGSQGRTRPGGRFGPLRPTACSQRALAVEGGPLLVLPDAVEVSFYYRGRQSGEPGHPTAQVDLRDERLSNVEERDAASSPGRYVVRTRTRTVRRRSSRRLHQGGLKGRGLSAALGRTPSEGQSRPRRRGGSRVVVASVRPALPWTLTDGGAADGERAPGVPGPTADPPANVLEQPPDCL